QGWPGAEKDYNANVQVNVSEEIAFFLDESMKASKFIADNISLTENNLSNYEEERNPYVRMFADKDLSSYDEVIFWRAGDAASFKVGYGYAHTQGGSNTGYTRAYVNSFLMEDGSPIYSSSDYQGDELLANVKQGRDNRLVQFMKIKGEAMSKLNNGELVLFPEPQIITTAEYKSTTGYDIKKGLTMSVDDKIQNNQVVGVIEYRAAEAYLNYIEACYLRKGSIDASADKYWKAIRKRAGVSEDYRRTIELTDMSKESCLLSAYTAGKLVDKTMFNIRRERACELMSEGFRWDDLRRWRSMDQLVNTPYQVEGFKLWGEMKNWYTGLHYEGDGQGTANVSSPALSDYIRPYQIIKDNNSLYDGLKWTPANYLSPIGISQFTITSASVSDISSSPLYQNPGWPKVAGGVAESVPGF
ncbi:RagB/SusD family nutrient uptake outer membrane protein, partial [Phocaeicola vulgatus]